LSVTSSTCTALNPFKKIMYISYFPGTIYAINIDSANYHIVGDFSSQVNNGIEELHYDYFSNCLIFEDVGSVKKYDLNTHKLDLITNVYPIGAVVNTTPRSTYNQKFQHFYAINVFDNYHLILKAFPLFQNFKLKVIP